MHSDTYLAHALATAFLRGEWTADQLSGRAADMLGRRWPWLHRLAERVVTRRWGVMRPTQAQVTDFILRDAGFHRAYERYDLSVTNWLVGHEVMCPAEKARAWRLPEICTSRELANWLGVSIRELDWFADSRCLSHRHFAERRSHYRYRLVSKRFGQARLIEAPKARLKAIQRRILTGILEGIPPHLAAHAFRHGTSICTFAAPHVGRHVVVRLDLRDFFPSISRARVRAVFRTAGYPEQVATTLAELCTSITPLEIWNPHELRAGESMAELQGRYGRPHLPQGAPSSPALANLCAYRLDCRLTGLAESVGAAYSRYADDLAFSGDDAFRLSARRFSVHASAIALDEGFSVHHRKTRIMHRGVRQQLAGIVVNERLNLRRSDYEQLKATLTNCVRHGPASQNREGHSDFRRYLEGRISFVHMLNEAKGSKLKALFQRIRW
ncbi:MAG: reverse transcriptase family protein [Pirellulaceae bacterium]